MVIQSKTRWILISGFLLSLIIFFGLFSYGISQFEEIKDNTGEIVNKNNNKSEHVAVMVSSARERVLNLYAMVSSDDPFYRDDLFMDFNKQAARFINSRAALFELNLSQHEQELLESQGKFTGVALPIQNEIVNLIQNDEIEAAKELLNEEGVEAQNRVLDVLGTLMALQQKKTRAIVESIDTKYEESQRLIVLWAIVAFIVAAAAALFVIAKINNTEHRLFEEMEKTRATLGSISDIIMRVDSNGEIVFANRKTDDVFGEDVCGNQINEILPFVEVADLFRNDNVVDGRLGLFELEVAEKKYWLEVIVQSIRNEHGDVTSKVLVLHDLTEVVAAKNNLEAANETLERRVEERTINLQETNAQLKESLSSLAEAQEQLVHSEKMAALGGLVAGISHEINTPVGIGVTSATNIEEKMKSLEDSFLSGKLTKREFESTMEHTRKGLDILIANLNRASDLIKSFKQVAVDQSSDEFRHVDVREYFDEIIMSLHPKLKNTNIQLINEAPESIVVYTNPGALYQIISNLIVNSVVHAFDDSQEDERIVIDAIRDGEELVVEYSDNGKGVDEDALVKIYEPFYTTKRGQGGSGLGMNVVYNLVTTSLNGRIDIDSHPGEGLKVSIKLPVMEQVEAGVINE